MSLVYTCICINGDMFNYEVSLYVYRVSNHSKIMDGEKEKILRIKSSIHFKSALNDNFF